MIKLAIAAILAFVSTSSMAAGESSIRDFTGRWTGKAIETSDQSVSADVLNVEISERDSGFELSWNDLAFDDEGSLKAKPFKARFVSTNRANVFEYAPEAGSFLDRMFASPETGNPLEGETLLWARMDSGMLAVYSLKIDKNGEFALDHYSWTMGDDGLVLSFRKRTEELGSEIVIEGRLTPAGD